MRFRTYTMLGALASAIGGVALAAVLLRYVLSDDWWLIGAVLTVGGLAVAYGLIRAHRQSAAYGDMTVTEVRERRRRGELPPPLTPDQLRGWRRMMVLMWLAVPALPLLLRYAGLDWWRALIFGAVALCAAVSNVFVYQLLRRSSAPNRSACH
jgi:hypothetical protein